MKTTHRFLLILFALCALCTSIVQAASPVKSWTSDNGNGTFTNPLFYDEFSDPDMIRVGDDFYLAGTTMHCMPGLVVLHSKDLVNWEFCSYCFDRLDIGDEFYLTNGKEAYGQGVWAPCIRYHKGMFYIFTNINHHGLKVFTSPSAKGPWKMYDMPGEIYDLSVLFDDDDKIYAVYRYNEVKMIELKPDLSGFVEGSERVIIPGGNAMGEGHHFYKINGKYYITSANFSPSGRMQCARADRPEGPYETVAISVNETMGRQAFHWARNTGLGHQLPEMGYEFNTSAPANRYDAVPMHQGGIVDLPNGDWWGFSMMDFHGVGRTTCLSPVTWKEGWPYFGLSGNLGRTPSTWFKPNVEAKVEPHAPYERCDNFDSQLQPVWQWNHNPVPSKWALKNGKLRLQSMAAKDFLWARNTLTQRVIGPRSVATVELDASHLKAGDVAGLGLLNIPFAWIAVEREAQQCVVKCYDQLGNKMATGSALANVKKPVYLRATTDLWTDKTQFSYSLDGTDFVNVGDSILHCYQAKTFQGARYSLFAYQSKEGKGGYAEFDNFQMDEPQADRTANLPLGKVITLTNLSDGSQAWANPHGMLHVATRGSRDFNGTGCQFRVHDYGKGQVALEAMSGLGFLTVVGEGLTTDIHLQKKMSPGSLFMWQDLMNGQCMLLSMRTHRYVGRTASTGEAYCAVREGCEPNRKDGTVFAWSIVKE